MDFNPNANDVKNHQAHLMEELEESRVLISGIDGGTELLNWLGGLPNFGDCELVDLFLNRVGPSGFGIILTPHHKPAIVRFELKHWIDVNILGFSHQNVIGSLKFRPAPERDVQPWERGVGLEPGEVLIELEPCFGAYGTIRANISRIVVEPTV